MKRKLHALANVAMLMGHYTKKTATVLLVALLLFFAFNATAQTPPDCSCVNSTSNLITNGSFEEEEDGWSVSGGTLTTGTGYVVCGSQNGFLNWSSGTAKLWQQKSAQPGYNYTFKAYAGTHTPGLSCSPKLSLIFLNSSGSVIGTPVTVTVTKDVDVTGNSLALYTLTATAPAGTVTVRPEASITCNTLKLDAFCLTVSLPPVDCSCVNSPSNLLTNPSFENGTTGWTAVNGTFSTGTGYVMCGSANGFLYATTGTALLYQDKAVAEGSIVTFKGYSGTHTPGISCNPKLSLIYLNSMGAKITQSDAIVTKDVDATGPSLTQYTLSGTAPLGTVSVRVQGSISCDYLKVDAFCLTVTPPAYITNPDLNTTFVNVSVPGSVNTNDKVPTGTTYGTSPTLVSSPSGSIATLIMNSNGTYSFTANTPGVYSYDVQVCVPGQTAPCPVSRLVITVLNAIIITNAPVANVDISTTNFNTAVTLQTLANDAAGNPNNSLVPSSVVVTSAPKNGTNSVNATTGNITYTPNAGFTGMDTLTYQVCDNQVPAKCATALEIITVKPSGSALNTTTAADDYKITTINTPATGNVSTNDRDAEGNMQTVTAQSITVSGKYTFILNPNGSYTFTPVNGFTGPVDFPYTTCDNGTPLACATATLHILVEPAPYITNPDFNSTFVNVAVTGNTATNDMVPTGTTYGTTPTLVSSPSGSVAKLTMNSNGTYSFTANTPGVYTYDVQVCVPGQSAPCPPARLVITVLSANSNTNPPVANVDIATTNFNTAVTLKTLANDAAGNLGNILVSSSVVVTVAPKNGTTAVSSTGEITYTPNAGFTGNDTLTYQVCDNQTPAKCATALEIITVKPLGSTLNTTTAADDYKITTINTPATGNVKTNDSDAEGNTQTVTAQTTPIAGKGTLVLNTDGSYTFTPVTGFTGPVDFPYTTCDNGTQQTCASATLHILVKPIGDFPDFTPANDIDALSFPNNGSTRDLVVNIQEILNTPNLGSVVFRVRKLTAFNITYNPVANSANVFGGKTVNNNDWIFTENAFFITCTLKPGVIISGFGVSPVGFTITRKVGIPVNTSQNITVTIEDASGGDSNSANNSVVTTITAN